jgi:ABC-type Fe3+/spermidine/putrescine transport system ATPase subunit
MAAAIETWQLTKDYHGRSALRAMDLTVPRDVVFGYLGPNGAGKTTTIRMLAGLLRPTAGRAEINGHDVVRAREQAQRRLGYLPGEFTGYPDLTAQSYLSYLGNLRGGADQAVAVAAYLLYVAGELVEAVRPWQPLSPFDQALSDGPLGAGFRLTYLAMPATAALFLAAALPVFARRDIAVAH